MFTLSLSIKRVIFPNMKKQWIFFGIALLILYFTVFIFPNSVGSVDRNMISLFEPDEFAQYPHVVRMITPANEFSKTFRQFFAYQHYYYGFPFYLTSAFIISPIQFFTGAVEMHSSLMMLLLRQFISVLPMIFAILLYTFMQTRFKNTLRSFFIAGLLFFIPAVFENNLWWHPESLVILFIALVFYFLQKDNLEFGKFFYLAAVFTGLTIGTKLIGLYFFLAIPTYILLGLFQKKISLKKAVLVAVLFVSIMAIMVPISNPMLFTPHGRAEYFRIQSKQMEAMSFGWQVRYEKGPASWMPLIHKFYGNYVMLALSFAALGFGIYKKETRLHHLMIAMWVVPYALYILFFIAIKPTHFFLPIILPLYSSLINLFDFELKNQKLKLGMWAISGLIIGYQLSSFFQLDYQVYQEKLFRESNSPKILFYDTVESQYLVEIEQLGNLVGYRDVRIYVPNSSPIEIKFKWGSIDHNYIYENDFDLLFFWKQRAADYTQEDTVANAADPMQMQLTYDFYLDVRHGTLEGYQLLYVDQAGMFFVSDEIHDEFFNE